MTRHHIRLAVAADLPEVVALEQECYSDPWPASAFNALTDNPRVFFAVARHPDTARMSGYAVAWFVMDEGELANLAVAAPERKKGLGHALLQATLSDAAERGTSQMYLEVRESNAAARALYALEGFTEIGRRKGYYRSPVEDALILRRTLQQ